MKNKKKNVYKETVTVFLRTIVYFYDGYLEEISAKV